jgi:hypothetical protein
MRGAAEKQIPRGIAGRRFGCLTRTRTATLCRDRHCAKGILSLLLPYLQMKIRHQAFEFKVRHARMNGV